MSTNGHVAGCLGQHRGDCAVSGVMVGAVDAATGHEPTGGPVRVDSLEKFVAAFGLTTLRPPTVYGEPDEREWYERLLPVFGWEDAHGSYQLWGRAGPRHGPPYDELTVVCTPYDWGIGIDYQTDEAYRRNNEIPEGARNRGFSIQLGPFHLWLGRTW